LCAGSLSITEIYSNISHLQLGISPTAQQLHLHDRNTCLKPAAVLTYTTGNLRQTFKNHIKKKSKIRCARLKKGKGA